MIYKLALRHLFRHWRLNLVLLALIVLGASLLASLPMLAVIIAGENLSQSLQAAPVHVRNIIIQGKSKNDEIPGDIERALAGLLHEMIAVREGPIAGFPSIYKSDGNEIVLSPATLVLNLRSFDHLDERVRVLDGRLPQAGVASETAEGTPIFEAAIGAEAARRSALSMGDEVAPLGGSYRLRIVGIVEPLHPDSEIWWGDIQMLPFSVWRRIHISPDIDEWNISLLLHPQTMISKVYHTQYWRIILDFDVVTAMNAASVRETLTELQSSLSDQDMTLRTGLIDLIALFEEALALARVSLLLLTFQSLFAILYLLGMFGSFLVEQSRMELSTLSSRGFSRGQIAGLIARSSILLTLLAGFVAPWVARWFLGLWADSQAIPRSNFIPVESWWLALVTALFSWIFLVISVYRATRRDLLLGQGTGMRFDDRVLNQRHLIWDIFILTLGGLSYWQLFQGSTITREMKDFSESSVIGISDPILLLGPTLLLLAITLIMIRLLPLLWRFFSWISRRARGLIWTLGFSRLSRQPVEPSQVTLLISLTVGLTFFASVFNYSIVNWQQIMARYVVGADIRLRKSLIDQPETTMLVDSPGIMGVTQVFRVDATAHIDEYQRLEFDLLAVDPATFPSVFSYPPGISPYSIGQIMRVLQRDSPTILPVVISSRASTRHLNIGDQITIVLGMETYTVEIVGIIENFPLLDDFFAITDLSQLSQLIDQESFSLTDRGFSETWLAVDPNEHETIVAKLDEAGLKDSIVGNSRTQLEIYRNNLVFREVITAFELNALVLIPLSVVGFFLIQLFSAQRRGAEFTILRAVGLSKYQLRSLLMFDGIIVITLGLIVGTGIGYGMAAMMQPFFSQMLPQLGRGFVLNQMLVDWPEIGVRLFALMGFYGVGLLVLMLSTLRNLRSTQF